MPCSSRAVSGSTWAASTTSAAASKPGGTRTMVYMSTSLALTAGGIILGYLLVGVQHVEGKTMNWTLAQLLAGDLHMAGAPIGRIFVVLTIASEALLLFVAAQAGFIAGPR